MLKKAKLYSLLALIVTSTVVGLFSFSSTASAQSSVPEAFIPEGLPNSIEAKMLREGMLKCLMGSNYVRRQNISSGQWFGTDDEYSLQSSANMLDSYTFNGTKKDGSIRDNQVNVSHFAEPNDGRYECYEGDGTEFVKKFIQVYNLGSPEQAACALGFVPYYTTPTTTAPGFTRSDPVGGDCLAPTRNNFVIPSEYSDVVYIYDKDESEARNTIDAAFVASSKIPQDFGTGYPRDNSLYALYVNAFFKACTDINSGISTDSTYTAGDYFEPVMIVTAPETTGEDPKVTPVLYEIASSDEVHVRIREDMKNEEMSCSAIVTEINNRADGYAAWVQEEGFTADDAVKNIDPSLSDEYKSTCRVDGIGWIICPVVTLMAEMVDSSYYLLDNSLLRTPAVPLGSTEPLYQAWKLMRDFANVAFVLIFMFIIFSQITSFGISNYGIKQLLPKLIIAAILVNLSYLICALAVDVSNLIGSELKSFLDDIASDMNAGTSSGPLGWDSADDGSGKAGVVGWGVIAGSILVAAGLGGGILAVLALLVPFLFAALGAVIATVLTLIIRQALIIVLIFIAPLAFVALLLPNTESYFKNWRKLFQSLLLLYPIIALVFGGSALASRIIMAAAEASTHGDSLGDGLGSITQTLLQLSGAAVSVVPLFLVPTVIKVAGGALNRFAGVVNNPNKGPIDWARNRSMKGIERMQKNQASKAFERRAEELKNPTKKSRISRARGRAGDFLSGNSKYYKDADMKQEDTNRDRELALQESNYNTNQALARADLTGKADGRQVREVATAVKQRDELSERERQATIAVLEEIGLSSGANHQLAMNGTVTVKDKDGNDKTYEGGALQEAAALRDFRIGGMKDKMETLMATGQNSGEGKEVLRESRARILDEAIKANMPKDALQFASGNLDKLSQGTFEEDRDTIENIKTGKYTPGSVGGGHSYAFKRAVEAVDRAIESGSEDGPIAADILKRVVKGIEDSPQLRDRFIGDKDMEGAMSKVKAWKPTPENTPQPTSSTPQQPAPAPINSGRQRDWSGYGQPVDTGMPTQTESPTFTPSQPSAPPASASPTVSSGRSRDWSGYDSGSSATAEAVEKVAKELRGVANKIGESPATGSATPAPVASPQPAAAPPTISNGRQRDWSGYSTPSDGTMPTQTESPTFRPNSNNTR